MMDPFEIFEWVSTHLKTDHFKIGVSLEIFLLEYLLCLNDNLRL